MERVGNDYTVAAAAQNTTAFIISETNLSRLIDDLNSSTIRNYSSANPDSPTLRIRSTVTSITNGFSRSAAPVVIAIQN